MKDIRQIRAAAFERLQKLDTMGKLTARRVIQEARNPRSPLHHAAPWTWDKAVAAQQWLEHQARVLIESYYVTVSVEAVPIEDCGQVVAFVRDPEAAPGQQLYTAASGLRGEAAQLVLEHEVVRIAGYIHRGWGIAQQLQLQEEYITRLGVLVEELAGVPA